LRSHRQRGLKEGFNAIRVTSPACPNDHTSISRHGDGFPVAMPCFRVLYPLSLGWSKQGDKEEEEKKEERNIFGENHK
jgi:hypothetical protein